jgi:DNA-binding XRE family transcriptional regulator
MRKPAEELKRYRKELGVVQFDMAMSAGIRPNTYTRIESGYNCSYTTAKAILGALNAFRDSRGLPAITHVEELGLTIV